MPKPSVGRAVHYVSRGSGDGKFPPACRAADITEVKNDTHVGLMVKNPTGLFFYPIEDDGVFYDGNENPKPGTWHWPERTVD